MTSGVPILPLVRHPAIKGVSHFHGQLSLLELCFLSRLLAPPGGVGGGEPNHGK